MTGVQTCALPIYYDAQTAQRVAGLDIPCFACPPEKLPTLLERALKGQELDPKLF